MPPSDWLDWAKLGWSVVQALVTAAIAVHLYLSDRQRVRRDALDAMEDRLLTRIDGIDNAVAERLALHSGRLHDVEAQLSRRTEPGECNARAQLLTQMQEQIRHLPTAAEVKAGDARAHQRIDRVGEGLAEIRGSLQHMQGTLDMLAQPLLSRLGQRE